MLFFVDLVRMKKYLLIVLLVGIWECEDDKNDKPSIPTYSLSVTISPSGTGEVNLVEGVFEENEQIELTAIAAQHYQFHNWTGSIESTDNPLNFSITQNLNLIANFIDVNMRALTLDILGEGTVEKRLGDSLVNVTTFLDGSNIELTAIPDNNWYFDYWVTPQNIENPTYVEISSDTTIIVKFMRNYNYKIPSHDWENYYMPWFDLANIVSELGFSKADSYNTNSAYADFNSDGYIDIMIQPNVNDGIPVNTFFLINNGDNTFYVDNDFPFTQNASVISSRKTIVGDFNNDGKPDVVRPQGGHDYLGLPQITLSTDQGYLIQLIGDGPLIQPHTVSSGDIDNDGDLDLFFAQSGEFDGFLINNGDATFQWQWISEIINDFDAGHIYPDGNYGYYGIWSSEITDVDEDGFVDLIFGGSYKDEDYDANFDGPTIFWGDGSGSYYNSNSTTLFDSREINYSEGNSISLSHDYAVNDVDGDGIKDIAVFSECSDIFLYHFIKGAGNRQFVDMTSELLPDNVIYNSNNHVWILMRDIDENGLIDIVEGEPVISIQWSPQNQTGYRSSLRWEWNGNSFTKIN